MTVQDFFAGSAPCRPSTLQQLKAADDTTLTQFARVLTQNTLLLREADSAGIRPRRLEWKSARAAVPRASSTRSKTEMGLADRRYHRHDGERPTSGRRWQGLKMEQYFDQLIGGKARLRPLPSALATLLRERLPFRIDDAGVGRAVEIAKDAKAKADSAAAAGSDATGAGWAADSGRGAPGSRRRPRRRDQRPARRLAAVGARRG